MKKMSLFFLLILLFNLESIELKTIDNNRIQQNKEQLEKIMTCNKFFSYGSTALGLGLASYLAYRSLKPKVCTVPNLQTADPLLHLYPTLYYNREAINDVCHYYKNGELVVNRNIFGIFTQSIPAFIKQQIPLLIAQGAATSAVNYLNGKLFKKYDINYIIREQTNFAVNFAYLKRRLAVLDYKSEIFQKLDETNMNILLSSEYYEYYNLNKNIRIVLQGNNNSFDEHVPNLVNDSILMLNNITLDCEKVIAYLESQMDKVDNSEKTNELKIIKGQLEYLVKTKSQMIYSILNNTTFENIHTNPSSGLFSIVMDYGQELNQLISRIF